MIEKNSQEAKIRKGSPARNPVCYQTTRDIVIPVGTILRANGGNEFTAAFGLHAEFLLTLEPGTPVPEGFKKVIA